MPESAKANWHGLAVDRKATVDYAVTVAFLFCKGGRKMAWTAITYSCGHEGEKQLFGPVADQSYPGGEKEDLIPFARSFVGELGEREL